MLNAGEVYWQCRESTETRSRDRSSADDSAGSVDMAGLDEDSTTPLSCSDFKILMRMDPTEQVSIQEG